MNKMVDKASENHDVLVQVENLVKYFPVRGGYAEWLTGFRP